MKVTGDSRVAIVTFHCSYNYGSVLQAYALQKYVKKHCSDVKIIDYRSKNYGQYRLVHRRGIIQPGLLVDDLKNFKRNLKRKRAFWKFISENLELTKKVDYKSDFKGIESQFDTFICGSDQIWNPGCTNGPDPVFYLQFATEDKTTIAYAPSFAQETFDKETISIIRNFTKNITYLSVREKSGQVFLEKICDRKVENVLDPTLLLNRNDYNELLIQTEYSGEKYIFMYMLEAYNQELVSYVAELSKEKKIPIVYISKDDISEIENGRNMYGISPNEFLSLIMNAEYIVTNSFHATVFSVLFEKQFCTFRTGTSFSRMVDFLQMIGLETRLNIEREKIDDAIDYSKALNLLQVARRSSEHYLLHALSINE